MGCYGIYIYIVCVCVYTLIKKLAQPKVLNAELKHKSNFKLLHILDF